MKEYTIRGGGGKDNREEEREKTGRDGERRRFQVAQCLSPPKNMVKRVQHACECS